MKIPNAELAIVDIEKLSEYCLNPLHPRGRHKARVFAAVGILPVHAESLRSALLEAVKSNEAVPEAASEFGQRYVIDFEFNAEGRIVIIRSAWIVRNDEELPRLTTRFVL